jgi:hypothetical protein
MRMRSRPSTVVIFFVPTESTGVWHDRCAAPSRCTVHLVFCHHWPTGPPDVPPHRLEDRPGPLAPREYGLPPICSLLESEPCFPPHGQCFAGRAAALDARLRFVAAVHLSSPETSPTTQGSHRHDPAHRRDHASRNGHLARASPLAGPAGQQLSRCWEPRLSGRRGSPGSAPNPARSFPRSEAVDLYHNR